MAILMFPYGKFSKLSTQLMSSTFCFLIHGLSELKHGKMQKIYEYPNLVIEKKN